jgi:hypothetical protein
MSAVQAAATPRGIERWAGLGGVLYVVLFVVGNIVAFSGAPTGDERPAKYLTYYADSGHRDKIALGWALVLLAVFCFLWFLVALRQVVAANDPSGFLTLLTAVGGAIYAALTLAGISLWTGAATMADDTFHHVPDPGVIHAASDAGYVMHASGGVGAGAMMIAASLALMRAARIPRWAGITGIVFGVLGLFSVFFFPQVFIAIWILAAGWLVYRAA